MPEPTRIVRGNLVGGDRFAEIELDHRHAANFSAGSRSTSGLDDIT